MSPVDGRLWDGGEVSSLPFSGSDSEREAESHVDVDDEGFLSSSATDRRIQGSRRDVIRRQRETTILSPELMSAHRRTRLLLREGEVERTMSLRVDGPLELCVTPLSSSNDRNGAREKDQEVEVKRLRAEAEVVFYRRVPSLSAPIDEEAYIAACRRTARVVGTDAEEEGGWYCHKIIRTVYTDADGSVHSAQSYLAASRERCLHVNGPASLRCASCGSFRPDLRPFFRNLSRIDAAVRRQRAESLRRMELLDTDVTRCRSVLMEARERMAQMEDLRARAKADGGDRGDDDDEDEENVQAALEDIAHMDVDLAQRGVWQRAEVTALVPTLESRLSYSLYQLRRIRGELSVAAQAVFGSAALHVQRSVRGHLVRVRLDSVRTALIKAARFAAATEVQRFWRGNLARLELQRRREARRHAMATVVQCAIRRMLARMERARLRGIQIERMRREAAVRIQSWWRMCMARMLRARLDEERRRRLANLERARLAALRRDAATIIQRIARRMFAKRAVFERRIELSLHDRLVRLVDCFMVDGDLWRFLKCINDDYRRYENIIDRIIEREDTMAATFVSKVMQQRQVEHTGAWKKFQETRKYTTLLGEKTDSTAGKQEAYASVSAPPGQVLQSAFRSVVLNNSATEPPSDSDRLYMYRNCDKSKPRCGKDQRHDRDKQCPKARDKGTEYDVETPSYSHIDVTGDPICDPLWEKDWESVRLEEMSTAGFGHTSSANFPGILRREIPQGLDDTLERLLCAVSLRCHIPRSFDGNLSLAEAHQKFLRMPPGLNKARIEVEARELARPVLDQMQQFGFTFIRQALPRGRMISLLQNLNCPVADEFVSTCDDVVDALEKAERLNCLSRKNVASLVKEFKRDQSELYKANVRHVSDTDADVTGIRNSAGFELQVKDTMCAGDGFDDVDLPGGLWSEHEISSDDRESGIYCQSTREYQSRLLLVDGTAREPIMGSSYRSRRQQPDCFDMQCNVPSTTTVLHHGHQETPMQGENIEEQSSEEDSTVRAPEEACLEFTPSAQDAKLKFQRELERLVRGALLQVKGDGRHPTGGSDFEDGLFHNKKGSRLCPGGRHHEGKLHEVLTKKNSTKKRAHSNSRREGHSSWVIPYTTRILTEFDESHPVYHAYRHGPHLLTDSGKRSEGNNCYKDESADALEAIGSRMLPSDMKQYLQEVKWHMLSNSK